MAAFGRGAAGCCYGEEWLCLRAMSVVLEVFWGFNQLFCFVFFVICQPLIKIVAHPYRRVHFIYLYPSFQPRKHGQVAAVDCSLNEAICRKIVRVHRSDLELSENDPVGAWGDLQVRH